MTTSADGVPLPVLGRFSLPSHALAALLATGLLEGGARFLLRTQETPLRVRTTLTLIAAQWMWQLLAILICWVGTRLAARNVRRPWLVSFGYFAVLFAAATLPMGHSLGSGAWISGQSFAWMVRWLGPALISMAGAGALAWAFVPRPAGSILQRVFVALLLVVSLAAAHINLTVMPGLYAPAHLFLSGVSALCAQWSFAHAVRPLVEARSGLVASKWVGVALTLAASFLLLRAPALNVAELQFVSVRAGYWVHWIAKAPTSHALLHALQRMGPDLARAEEQAPAPRTLGPIPSDWNVLLVVVDALRADAFPPGRAHQARAKRFTAGHAPFINGLLARSFTFDGTYSAANLTLLSMRSLLRSTESFDSDSTESTPLQVRMEALGRYPVVLLPEGLATRFARFSAPRLTDGFAEVHEYSRNRQNEMTPRVKALIQSVKDRPFFAWLHYISMHGPGWAKRGLSSRDGPWPKRYERALRWTDGEVAALFGELEAAGIASKTVVVFTADHGEGLGDSGILHHAGDALHEELIRVPLAIYIPGQQGRRVHATVGNIDIAPTLMDLLGSRSQVTMRGQSLLPLLADPELRRDAPYYMQTLDATRVAVVQRSRKYVVDQTSGAAVHYDLKKDRWEARPKFNPYVSHHKAMADLLTLTNPRLFAAEMADPEVDTWFDRRLRETAKVSITPRLRFMLELIAADPTPSRLAWARDAWRTTRETELQVLLLKHLFKADPKGFTPLLEGTLKELQDTPEEVPFIDDLADIAQPVVALDWFAARLSVVQTRPPREWLPWLRLLSRWTLPSTFATSLASMVGQLSAEPVPDVMVLRTLLQGLHGVKPGLALEKLVEACLGLVKHPDAGVRGAAYLALGHLGGQASTAEVHECLKSGPASVKDACLTAWAELRGEKAIPVLARYGKHRRYLAKCLYLVGQIGSPRGLPFVEWAMTQPAYRDMAEVREIREHLLAATGKGQRK